MAELAYGSREPDRKANLNARRVRARTGDV